MIDIYLFLSQSIHKKQDKGIAPAHKYHEAEITDNHMRCHLT